MEKILKKIVYISLHYLCFFQKTKDRTTTYKQLLVCFVSALLLACNNKIQTISHVRVFSSYPIDWNGNNIVYEVDSIDVYYYKDLVMYRKHILNIDLKESSLDNSQTDNTISYYYVVHKEGDKDGVYYYPDSLKRKYPYNIDSLLLSDSKLIFDSLHFQLKKLYKFTASNSDTVEKLIPIFKKNNSFSDTNFYFFSRDYRDVKFSLSPSLDAEKKIKLYKFIALFNGDPNSDNPYLRQKRELSFWFTRLPNEESAHLIKLFEEFFDDKKELFK